MKKKVLLSGLFALALLATAGYGMNQKVKSNANLSDLALANVEALAQSENGSNMVGYMCKDPKQGVGCGDIGQTGPPCSVKRYC
jgi:hypothetical protein